uniref:Cadherin N-terminal domain-containing protein n=1 Tax=Salarias fasciatus TaxID=181472 RepID=A0A672FTA3_SALFA
MGARGQRVRWRGALWFIVILCHVHGVSSQVKYSIPEEIKVGSVVGNVAKDLGLDITSNRRFRVVSESANALFNVNQD